MIDAIWQIKWEAQSVLVAVVALAALCRGAPPERWTAAIFIGMLVLDRAFHAVTGAKPGFHEVNLGHLLIDCAATAAFGAIGLQANRVYPLWLAGLQLMATVAHVVRAISPAIATGAYAILMIAPSYFQIAVFFTGLLMHIRRRTRYGPYRSWRRS